MAKRIRRISRTKGLPPGTLVHVGEKKTEKVRITIIDYDGETCEEKTAEKVEECFPFKEKPTVTWINVDGIHLVDVIEKIGGCFGLHPLLLEDILNTGQRPKMDEYGEYLFFVLKMLYHDEARDEITAEQVSIVLGPNFVISFQEREGDVFDPVRERIRTGKGRVRGMKSDYLAYSLMDAIVDNYFVILEKLEDRMELLEEGLGKDPGPAVNEGIRGAKKDMIFLRKSIWPLREVLSAFQRSEAACIEKDTRLYLRDVYDHTIQVMDTVESLRDLVSGMFDTYLSSVSNRMNEVMKVLTIFATTFIPLTFIAGVYGMNFEFMPELKWHLGYFAILFVMTLVAVIMLLYFRKKKWL
jgi:magnesium transporter